jgi:hypothetical protein
MKIVVMLTQRFKNVNLSNDEGDGKDCRGYRVWDPRVGDGVKTV